MRINVTWEKATAIAALTLAIAAIAVTKCESDDHHQEMEEWEKKHEENQKRIDTIEVVEDALLLRYEASDSSRLNTKEIIRDAARDDERHIIDSIRADFYERHKSLLR